MMVIYRRIRKLLIGVVGRVMVATFNKGVHVFETLEGDGLIVSDLDGSWIVVETSLEIDWRDWVTPVFTHRVNLHTVDVLISDLERDD